MNATTNQAQYPMPDSKNGKPRLDDLAATQIGRKLRAQFDEIVNEPVPDRFLELLNELQAAEKKAGKDVDHE